MIAGIIHYSKVKNGFIITKGEKMKLKKYDPELIKRRYIEKKMTMRALSAKTKDIDPCNNGVAPGTIQRVIKGMEALPGSLCLICAALEISPSSLFVDHE